MVLLWFLLLVAIGTALAAAIEVGFRNGYRAGYSKALLRIRLTVDTTDLIDKIEEAKQKLTELRKPNE